MHRTVALAAAFSTLLTFLALGAVTVRAEQESVEAHAKHPQKVVILDADRIAPSSLQMSEGDVLVFENQSVQPIVVTFVEPKDVGEKIHCSLVRKDEREKIRAPWLLFEKSGGGLSASIPPGRFASLCSLGPGTYAYTARLARLRTRQAGSIVPEKGQITVQ